MFGKRVQCAGARCTVATNVRRPLIRDLGPLATADRVVVIFTPRRSPFPVLYRRRPVGVVLSRASATRDGKQSVLAFHGDPLSTRRVRLEAACFVRPNRGLLATERNPNR